MTAKAGLKTLNHREDWQTARVKFLFKRETRPVLETDEVITAFRDGTVTLRKNRREDGFTFAEQEIGYQGVEPGDLVIHAMDGFAGAIGVSDSRGKGSPVLTVATPITHLDVRFWGYYLRNLAITGFIQSLAKGIRERSTDFRWKDVSNLLVNFPDLSTQREIADFLDRETARIDLLIEKKQKLVALLGEKRSAVITCAVTGHTTTSFTKTEAPVEWRWIKLSHAFPKIGSGTTPPDDQKNYDENGEGTNWVTSSELRETKIKITKKQVSSAALKRFPTLRVYKSGSVLFAMYGATIGRLGVLEEPACCNQACCVFERSQVIHNDYLVYWFQHRRNALVALSVGGGQPNLSQQDLRNEKVFCPDLSTQREITDFLDRETARIDAVKDKTLSSIDRLKEYRSALITAAVTGQIDVTTYAKSGATDRKLDAIQKEMGA